jgi:hypothetical protein
LHIVHRKLSRTELKVCESTHKRALDNCRGLSKGELRRRLRRTWNSARQKTQAIFFANLFCKKMLLDTARQPRKMACCYSTLIYDLDVVDRRKPAIAGSPPGAVADSRTADQDGARIVSSAASSFVACAGWVNGSGPQAGALQNAALFLERCKFRIELISHANECARIDRSSWGAGTDGSTPATTVRVMMSLPSIFSRFDRV